MKILALDRNKIASMIETKQLILKFWSMAEEEHYYLNNIIADKSLPQLKN